MDHFQGAIPVGPQRRVLRALRKDAAKTQAQFKIPFHNLKFHDELPNLRDIETRLAALVKTTRETAPRVEIVAGPITDEDRVYPYDLVDDADRQKIRTRATHYLERLHSSAGMYRLAEEKRVRLIPLKGGLPVAHIATEHEADEISAATYAEMQWMGPATEVVWHGLRASAREELRGVRFNPLMLAGSPGIGKIFGARRWARRWAHHLSVPTCMIDATGDPASSLIASQRGWGSAHHGKLMNAVLNARHAGALVVLDEVEKSGDVQSIRRTRHTLTDANLPLLERMTAQTWQCPFF